MAGKGNVIGDNGSRVAIEEFVEDSKARYSDYIKKLSEIAQSMDASRLLVAVFANIAFGAVDEVGEATHGLVPAKMELLAYHLYPFFGVSHKREITPWNTQECLTALDQLFRARGQLGIFSEVEGGEPRAVAYLKRSLRIKAEIVRGSAYPEQTAEEIISVQGRFERWFAERVGIGPKRAAEILWAIMRAQEKAYNDSRSHMLECGKAYGDLWKEAKRKLPQKQSDEDKRVLSIFTNDKTAQIFGYVQHLNEIAADVLPVSPSYLKSLDEKPSEKEWAALCKLIGMTTGHRKNMSDPIDVRHRPLFVLPDGRVVLADVSNALDVLWERFEEFARTDQVFYDKRYQRRKSKWLEDKISECLVRIFPHQHVYGKLSYPDPDKGSASTAELDIAVHWGPFLVMVEAKAKQFRMESHFRDIGRLATDIKANVADAFEQAQRAVRYIESVEQTEFIEVSTGRRLSFHKENIRRIYLITGSQHHLADLANCLAEFEDFGFFKDKEYPLSICVADLDTISQFCDGPDVFLHYIEKRLELLRMPVFVVASELETFGAYLSTRLQAEKIWEKDGKPIDGFMLTGFQDKFDQWMDYKREYREGPPVIKLNVPPEILEILGELRRRTGDDSARWIAFALLGLPDSGLSALAQMVREVRSAELTPGMFRRTTHQEGDTVISLVASLDLPSQMLRDKTGLRAVLEKYRRKTSKSVGIGIMVNDTLKPFDCAVWVEGPWQYEEDMEKLINSEPLFVPAPGQKLPGRNEPCICGSGGKFKKCCLPKIEAARREGLE